MGIPWEWEWETGMRIAAQELEGSEIKKTISTDFYTCMLLSCDQLSVQAIESR